MIRTYCCGLHHKRSTPLIGENELMEFGRRSGRLHLDVPVTVRLPTGKLASYAAIGQETSVSRQALTMDLESQINTLEPSRVQPVPATPPKLITAVGEHETTGASANSSSHAAAPVVPVATAAPADAVQVSVGAHIPDDTEQDEGLGDDIPEDTDLTARTHDRDADEAKSETDDPENVRKEVDLDVFDSGAFMDGMRTDHPFETADEDDINLFDMSDSSDSESDVDGEDVMADNETAPIVDGVDDVDDADVNEDDSSTQDNGLMDEELRAITKYG
jgi:hypothetical protein